MLTEEQRVKRADGLGASDTPIHMGYSKFMTPYELWLQKTGVVAPSEEVTELTYWGNKLERVIAERFEEDNNCTVSFPDTVYHPKYDFIFANLDGYVEKDNAVVEIKNVNSFMRYQWDNALEDGIPNQYLIQIAKQCMIVDASIGYCAVLIGGNEYQQYIYQRDPDLERHILNCDLRFWEMVKNNIPPDVQTLNDCKLKYKEVDDDKKLTANFGIESVWTELQNIKSNVKSLTERENEIKITIMDYMKDAQYLYDLNDRLMATWKANKKGNRSFLIKG